MCKFWKKSRSPFESSAKVVDGNLILSLPDAINPIVWRMELGSVKSSALEVRTTNDNNFLLTLKTPRGDVHDIAPYENREKAVAVLLKVSEALEGAEGKLAPGIMATPVSTERIQGSNSSSSGAAYKWLAALAAVIILVFLFSYLANMVPDITTVGTGETGTAASPESASGVPQSADDYLRGF